LGKLLGITITAHVLVVVGGTGGIHLGFGPLECLRTGVTLEHVDHVPPSIVVHYPVFALPLVQLDGLEAFYEHISI
jgi:hypothetical protein